MIFNFFIFNFESDSRSTKYTYTFSEIVTLGSYAGAPSLLDTARGFSGSANKRGTLLLIQFMFEKRMIPIGERE